MVVKIEMAIREGWKATENKRFGEVLELRFIDTNTNKILFRYAPNLRDEKVFIEAFALLISYDLELVKLREIIDKIDGRGRLIYGSCSKEEDREKENKICE